MTKNSNKKPILHAGRALMLACGLLVTGLVQASPVTYRFEMPKWTSQADRTHFGSHAILDITLDNGAGSTSLQHYLNSDIRQLRVRAVGGSLDLSFGVFWPRMGALDDSFISTDASGNAVLDLLPQPMGSGFIGSLDGAEVQLARNRPYRGMTTFLLSWRGLESLYEPQVDGTFPGVAVKGQLLTGGTVPEPSTWALTGLALLAAFVGRRRKA